METKIIKTIKKEIKSIYRIIKNIESVENDYGSNFHNENVSKIEVSKLMDYNAFLIGKMLSIYINKHLESKDGIKEITEYFEKLDKKSKNKINMKGYKSKLSDFVKYYYDNLKF